MTPKNIIINIILIFILSVFLVDLSWAQDADTVKSKQEIINIGYGAQPEWMVSGAVSCVKGNELQKNFTPDLGNTLYGRLPGLDVSQGNGEPGLQSPTLRIRGTGTFGTGDNILVLVDGYELPFGTMVPDEIESVTVLKDAAATAIYGSKGANGVMLVTTKRGKAGPLNINFSVQHGISSPTHLPKFLGSYDYAILYNEALVNDGKPELYSAADLEAYKTGSDPYFHPDVNWYNELLRKSVPTSSYNLNFNGGTKMVKYFVLLNMLSSSGLYKKTEDLTDFSVNSKYRRINYRSNVDIQLSNRLSAHLTLSGTIEDKSNPVNNTTESIFNSMALIPPNTFPVFNPNGTYGATTLYSNLYGDILETGMYTSNGRVFQGSFGLTEQLDMITKGLSVSARVSFNNTFTSLSTKSRDYVSFSIAKDTIGETIYTKIGDNTSLSGSEGQSDQWRSTTFQTVLNYARDFGENNVDAVMLFSSSDYSLGVGGLPYVSKGLYGRVTFANKQKYIGEFSFGYNGTDNFPTGSRWGFFPAASLGWIVSNENFLKDGNIVSYLKIRGSYGLTGNDNIGGTRYMYNENFGGQGNYYFGTANTAAGSVGESQIANPDVTWEKQKQLNIGLEATLWKKIDLSLDIFQQDRYDILAQPERIVPSFTGANLPDLNVGKVNNKGFEAMIRYNSDKSNSFHYYIQLNVWKSKNKIIYNSEPAQIYDYLYRTGHSISQPFLLEAIGLFEDQTDIDNSPRQIFSKVQPGDLKYKDQNGDNIIDQYDLYPIGRTGQITGGLSGGLQFKGFDFAVFIQGVTNRNVYVTGTYFEAFQNNGKVSEIALGRWTPSTASSADYPRLSSENNLNNFQPSSFWQRDGSFIKLRSIELGYTLSENLVKRIKINTARVYLNGTDLFSLDHMDFTDPETIYGYPPVRTFSLGVRLNF